MDIYFLGLLALLFFGFKVKKNGFFEDYLDRKYTSTINGFFLLLVLFTHSCQYVVCTEATMPLVFFMRSHIAQLVVTTFLFYSGYGIMESIKKKGDKYINSLPRRRILKVWLNLALAVIIYAVIAFFTKNPIVTIKGFIFSLFGWESLGNSNWYMFTILAMYVITYISFKAYYKKYNDEAKTPIIITFIAAIFLIIVMMYLKAGQSWWYNTMLCYPCGMLFSYYKEKIEIKTQNNNFSYFTTLIGALLIFLICYMLRDNYSINYNLFWYEIMAASLPLFISIVLMKFRFYNKALSLIGGKYLFSFYIMMRIPMNYMRDFTSLPDKPVLFFTVALLATAVLTLSFDFLTRKIFNKLTA